MKVRKLRKRRLRARDFGDDPRIRHSHGEHTRINMSEPWERRYAKKFRRLLRVKAFKRHRPGKPYGRPSVKVSGYSRLLRRFKRKRR